jgi:hypothetical protein
MMTAELEGSYATLERKVAERTQELTEASRAKSRFPRCGQPRSAAASACPESDGGAVARRRIPCPARASGAEDRTGPWRRSMACSTISLISPDSIRAWSARRSRPSRSRLSSIASRAAFTADAQAKGLRFRIRTTGLWVLSDPLLLQTHHRQSRRQRSAVHRTGRCPRLVSPAQRDRQDRSLGYGHRHSAGQARGDFCGVLSAGACRCAARRGARPRFGDRVAAMPTPGP